MAVITISREFGSVDDNFGDRVAQQLGYHCVCKEFIAELLRQYGVVDFDQEYDTRPGFWEGFVKVRGERRTVMVGMLNQVLQAVAQHGNVVIQGRSGFAALAGFADVIHVRLQAPLAVRIERVADQHGVTREEATRMVKAGDAVRTAFVEEFYGISWNAVQAFDIVINTAKVPVVTAVAWVVQAAQELADHAGAGDRSISALQVDDILARAVSAELEAAVGYC